MRMHTDEGHWDLNRVTNAFAPSLGIDIEMITAFHFVNSSHWAVVVEGPDGKISGTLDMPEKKVQFLHATHDMERKLGDDGYFAHEDDTPLFPKNHIESLDPTRVFPIDNEYNPDAEPEKELTEDEMGVYEVCNGPTGDNYMADIGVVVDRGIAASYGTVPNMLTRLAEMVAYANAPMSRQFNVQVQIGDLRIYGNMTAAETAALDRFDNCHSSIFQLLSDFSSYVSSMPEADKVMTHWQLISNCDYGFTSGIAWVNDHACSAYVKRTGVNSAVSTDSYNLPWTFTHEMGHSFGMDHPASPPRYFEGIMGYYSPHIDGQPAFNAQNEAEGCIAFRRFNANNCPGFALLPPPTASPTLAPTGEPTVEPTLQPTLEPTLEPTLQPTNEPTLEPTNEPTLESTNEPTLEPTIEPTAEPTGEPTTAVTAEPTTEPTAAVSTDAPTSAETESPTVPPTLPPTDAQTSAPTDAPSAQPSGSPPVSRTCVQLSTYDQAVDACAALAGGVVCPPSLVGAECGPGKVWTSEICAPGRRLTMRFEGATMLTDNCVPERRRRQALCCPGTVGQSGSV